MFRLSAAAGLGLAALLSVSSAHADGYDPAKVGGEITFITNRTDLIASGYFDGIKDKFKAKYPAVTDVSFEGVTNYEGDVRVRMSSHDYGDVLLIISGIPQSELPNYFLPLDGLDFDGKIQFADYYAVDGKPYGAVSGVNAEGLIYNKKAFAKAGVDKAPTTLTELIAASEKLKAAGIVPFATNFRDQWPLQQWDKLPVAISGDGAYYETMLKTDAPFSADTPYGKSVGILKTLIDKGLTEPDLLGTDWESSKGKVASGEFAMYFLGNWAIPQVVSAGAAPEDIGFVPFPYGDEPKLNAIVSKDWAYAVSKYSKNPDTAKAFVEFMVDDSGYDVDSGFLPARKDHEPTLPQLKEFLAVGATPVYAGAQSDTWSKVAAEARLDVFQGGWIQKLILAKDYGAAIDELNKNWAAALAKVTSK